MKKLLILLIVPFISLSQNFYETNIAPIDNSIAGCVDLDETFMDLISIFGDTSLLDGLLGCSDLIPVLESGLLSTFLPFNIPLDCNTDLTPFGYLDVNLSDMCECSCQTHLKTTDHHLTNLTIVKTTDLMGRKTGQKGFHLHIYNDGSVEKKYKF